MKRRSKSRNMFVRTVNVIFVLLVFTIGLLLFIFSIENENDVMTNKSKSLLNQSKEETMLNNELIKNVENDIANQLPKRDDFESKTDPELEYAIKLFESNLVKLLKPVFNKPFNYKTNSYCTVSIDLAKPDYKFKECNSDSIFKRELELALELKMPLKRFTYNGINLKKKKIVVNLNMD